MSRYRPVERPGTPARRRRVLPIRGCAALVAILLATATPLAARQLSISGTVTDDGGAPLAGVRVTEAGTLNATTTASDGSYAITVSTADAVLVFSLFGHATVEARPAGAPRLDVVLRRVIAVAGIEVVGTRRLGRSAVDTPNAIDVLDPAALTLVAGWQDVNRILHYAAPSFNANRQSGADGSDHIDPASLRGLGPDQTLVLVNGKRRHASSLVNIFGTRGRGSTGTDLNAIPASAIERIEILRDGASAQYGSDAIAGVINIVLKSSVDGFDASFGVGAHDARPPSRFEVLRADRLDGESYRLAANYGVRLGETGFLNTTAEWHRQGRTLRPADPDRHEVYRRRFGDAAVESYSFYANAMLPLSERTALYAFGGYQLRDGDAYAWSREAASERNVPAIYPDGFDPRILSAIDDRSLTLGVRTEHRGWDVDVYGTFGVNAFHYFVDGTLNASLLEASPIRFDAGGFRSSQQTTGARLTRFLPAVASGLNVAFGAEHRVDRYAIFAGEEASYRNYGIAEVVVDGRIVPVDTLGRPGGAQGFPGFRPDNEVDERRSNVGAFVDLELDVTPRLLLSAATRAERYSDFGSTFTWKLAGRYRISDALAIRASTGTGFRAPSLQQAHFNSTFTDFVAGELVDELIARNPGRLTVALGVPPLREEESWSASGGVTLRTGSFSATADAYFVDIDNRIVLTGSFEADDPVIGEDLRRLGVGAARFFANALDTRTWGVDLVLAWDRRVGPHALRWSVAGNWNRMRIDRIHTSPRLAGREETYFDARERAFVEASAPESKVSAALQHEYGRFSSELRVTRFGEVELVGWDYEPYRCAPAYTVDLGTTVRVTGHARITVGAANLFDAYPTAQEAGLTETGGLWDAVQMGSSGAYFSARLDVKW